LYQQLHGPVHGEHCHRLKSQAKKSPAEAGLFQSVS